jgi:predicted transcriptional regulator
MLRRERVIFAAKVRGARAVLGWSQRELGTRVPLTQKSVYRMEQGTHDLRRSTVVTVEQVLKAEGIEFEDMPCGGFKLVVPEVILSKLEWNAENI